MTSIVPTVRLAYNTFKPDGGEDGNLSPIIYLHGATSYKENWEDIPQIVAHAMKRRAYAIDARNHGDSERSDYFNFDVNVEDLIHFMDTIGISKAILVGHSMGGITAMKTAIRLPDRIEKIVVEDMGIRKISKEVMETLLAMFELFLKAEEAVTVDLDEDGAKKLIMSYVQSNLTPQMLQMSEKDKNPEDCLRSMHLRRKEDGRYGFKANLEVIRKAMEDSETLMSAPQGIFEGPACFIYGKLSPFLVGADKDHIKQFFPNAIFEGIEETYHRIHTDRPVEFKTALKKFLSS